MNSLSYRLKNYLRRSGTRSRRARNAERRYLFVGIFSVLLFAGCSFYPDKNQSVLVIAVDSLKYDDITCENETEGESGFKKFCEDSIRFSHALTTSVLSTPALSSLLTARYPYEHGLWHNGQQFLSASVETIAERAVTKGVRTGFFSGGPPVWRKTGLAQGFEHFDDYISLSVNRLYRTAGKNVDLFFQWLDSRVNGDSFFGLLYFPDIQFNRLSTKDNQGQLRARTVDAQIEAIDEALFDLYEELLERDLWHKTHIILVGLNGRATQQRPQELEPYNLFSENIRVPLFIKPVSKRRDRTINWNVDANVNLVDVGTYIAEVLGVSESVPRRRLAEPISVLERVESQRSTWPSGRPLLVESGWPYWRLNSLARFAVVKDEKLVIYDNPVQAYNIWSDRFQVSPLDEEQYEDIEAELGSFLSRMGFGYFKHPPKDLLDKYLIAFDLWGYEKPSRETLIELESFSHGHEEDYEIHQWRAYWAVKLKKWKLLKKVAKDVDSPLLRYVANKNLGKGKAVFPADPCFSLLNEDLAPVKVLNEFRKCDDELFRFFVAWTKAEGGASGESTFKRNFLIKWNRHVIARRALELNWANGLVWDTSTSSYLGPSLVELAWSLPEYESYRKKSERRVGISF